MRRRTAAYLAVLRRVAQRWGVVFFIVLIWEAVSRLQWVDPLLLPPASAVLARGWALLLDGRLLAHLAASAWRVVLGFALAAVVAVPVGVALGLYPRLDAHLAALFGLLRPLSPPAWIPLAILWFGLGDAPAVFIIFVGTFSAMLVNVAAATRALDPDLVRAALTLGANRWQTILHVVLPALLPTLLAQVRVGLGLAWMCVIAAEMVAVRRGMGFFMVEARNLFRTRDVIVGMLAVGLVGLATDRLLLWAEAHLLRWRRGRSAAQFYGQASGALGPGMPS